MSKLLVLAIALTGCVPTSPTGYGYGYGTTGAPATTQAAGRTCVQVVECLATCTADSSCLQACVDSGDPDAQTAVNALIACNAEHPDDCDAELTTCRGQALAVAPQQPSAPVAGEAMLPNQPHTTANLIPWLTGEWTTSNHQFVFYGDGRVRRSDTVALAYNKPGERNYENRCVSVVNELGTVTQEGDLLIMTFGVNATNHCGDRSATAGATIRYKIEWIDNSYYKLYPELQLRLRDIDCDRGAMWCNDQMTRR